MNALVIPAAGRGTRLGADIPKLLVEVAGRSMIDRLLDLYRDRVEHSVLVLSPAGVDPVNRLLGTCAEISLAVQSEPTGMLDAILLATPNLLPRSPEWIWITWCDQVAMLPATIASVAAACDDSTGAAVVMPTIERTDPYIHLERDANGHIHRILQRREQDAMPERGESDMGLFVLSSEAFFELLPEYAAATGHGDATGERNFLPFLCWLRGRADVIAVPGNDPIESVGVNTPEELAVVEEFLRRGSPGRTLSVVMPAYNEAAFVGALIEQIRAVDLSSRGYEMELIVVDDGSSDETSAIAGSYPGVRVWRQEPNQGKGAAVRKGIELATGDALIIQDADLEYHPQDYAQMLDALDRAEVDAVYGSRYLRPDLPRGPLGWARARHPEQSLAAYWGGRSISLAAWATTGVRLTDTVTALKLFSRELIQSLPLETSGFELDHEITSRLTAAGRKIVEVPIGYSPRSKAEGKKIGFGDWLRALRTFWRYRRG